MDARHTVRVSCKVALFSPDMSDVLLADYGKEDFGLPGGHMETGETPDQTMSRELYEEFGLKGVKLIHKDFFPHHNGKIILGYMGIIDKNTPITVQVQELEAARWVSVSKITSGEVAVRSYADFIVRCANVSVAA